MNKTQVLNSPHGRAYHKAGIKITLDPESGQMPGQPDSAIRTAVMMT